MIRRGLALVIGLFAACPSFSLPCDPAGDWCLAPRDAAPGDAHIARCDGNEDCLDGRVCDTSTSICRDCEASSQCFSGICDPIVGRCVACNAAVFVGFDARKHECASEALFLDDLTQAVASVGGTIQHLAIASQQEGAGLMISGTVRIHGGVIVRPMGSEARSVFEIAPGSDVLLSWVKLPHTKLGDGIHCSLSHLRLWDFSIREFYGRAVSGDCDLDIRRSAIEANDNGVAGRHIFIRDTRFVDNFGEPTLAGLADSADIRNSLFARNGTGFPSPIVRLTGGRADRPGVFAFNTVVGNRHSGEIGGIIVCDGQDVESVTIESNILWGQEFGEQPVFPDAIITGCAVGANVVDQPVNELSILGDPRFVDPDAGNFDISPGSSAVGAGDPSIAPVRDLDGLVRGAAPDMGAYEAE